MMKFAFNTLAICSLLVGGSVDAAIVWQDSFKDPTNWPGRENYKNAVDFAFGISTNGVSSSLVVRCGRQGTKDTDTAWHVRSKRIRFDGSRRKFAFSYKVRSELPTAAFVTGGKKHQTALIWFDGEGREIAWNGLMPGIRKGGFNVVRLVGEVPKGAKAFEIQIGFDSPNIVEDRSVAFTELKLETVPDNAKCGIVFPDVEVPRVVLLGEWPSEDVNARLAISVTDNSEIDWDTLSICLDGEKALGRFRRNGSVLLYEPEGRPWTNGLHRVEVSVSDKWGNCNCAKKMFLVGRKPGTPRVALREDGLTLVDGKPFFPIGVYNICRCPFNHWDFERAVAELSDAGFNMGHSYMEPDSPEFLAAIEKHGMKLWHNAMGVDNAFVEKHRHNPSIVAWYIGDDTSGMLTPQELFDRADNAHALDSTRPNCQADCIDSDWPTDRYQRFASATDILLAEIYPVHGDSNDVNCVAQTIRDMRRIREDNRRFGGGRIHAVWPIIQNFIGWDFWRSYPTPEQVYAMSFASLIYGAKGITWYTYAPGYRSSLTKTRYDGGFTDDRAAWVCQTNLSRRISSLIPVLIERGERRFADPEVLEGPKFDGYGNPSISMMAKEHAGSVYLFTVNSTPKSIRTTFILGLKGRADVLWENRAVEIPSGRLTETFKPYAVHVYRLHKSKGEK